MAKDSDHGFDRNPLDTRGIKTLLARGQTPPTNQSMAFPTSYRPGQARSFDYRDVSSDRQKSDRESRQPSRILLPSFLGTQEIRGLATGVRPLQSESIPGNTKIQDGVCSHNSTIVEGKQVGYKHRHQRCLSPRPYASNSLEIPQTVLQGTHLPVSSTTIRSGNGTLCIYSNNTIAERNLSIEGDSFPSLHRRLAHCGRHAPSGYQSSQIRPTIDHRVRLDNQLGQITTTTDTTVRVRRDLVQPGDRICTTSRVENTEDKSSDRSADLTDENNSKINSLTDRPSSVRRETNTVWQMFPTSNTMVSSYAMEHTKRSIGCDDRTQRSSMGRNPLVAKPLECNQGDVAKGLHARQDTIHGRFRACLGSS